VLIANKERRQKARLKLSQPLRIRCSEPPCPTVTCASLNLSRNGFYFETAAGHFFTGMQVDVTRNFRPGDPVNQEEAGTVMRVEKLPNGNFGVAVRIFTLVSRAPRRPSRP